MIFWATLAAGPLVLAVAAEFAMAMHSGLHGLLWAAVAWLAMLTAAALHWQDFVCPRCQHRFFRARPRVLALRASCCSNCMLPKA